MWVFNIRNQIAVDVSRLLEIRHMILAGSSGYPFARCVISVRMFSTGYYRMAISDRALPHVQKHKEIGRILCKYRKLSPQSLHIKTDILNIRDLLSIANRSPWGSLPRYHWPSSISMAQFHLNRLPSRSFIAVSSSTPDIISSPAFTPSGPCAPFITMVIRDSFSPGYAISNTNGIRSLSLSDILLLPPPLSTYAPLFSDPEFNPSSQSPLAEILKVLDGPATLLLPDFAT